jgi:hypothetical protein
MRFSPDAGQARPSLKASVIGAFLEGWRRVLRAPVLALGLLAATFATALPLGLTLQHELAAQLGGSLEAERSAYAWNEVWASEFRNQGSSLASTFTHEILGFGGTLAATSALLDAEPLNPTIAAFVAAYVALWVFASGGILDRLARGRPVRTFGFFMACGGFFFRLLRLAVVAGACYWLLFRGLHPWLFGPLYDRWIADLASERQVVLVRIGLYLLFGLLLLTVNLVVDFAKVRAVVEDRRSTLGAIAAALRFVRRRPLRVLWLYVLNLLAAAVVWRLWLQTAPGAGASTWMALLAGQLYILGRLWAKLAFMASEVVFFQGELAHARYTAAPEPVWPDAAGVEAIRNLRRSADPPEP